MKKKRSINLVALLLSMILVLTQTIPASEKNSSAKRSVVSVASDSNIICVDEKCTLKLKNSGNWKIKKVFSSNAKIAKVISVNKSTKVVSVKGVKNGKARITFKLSYKKKVKKVSCNLTVERLVPLKSQIGVNEAGTLALNVPNWKIAKAVSLDDNIASVAKVFKNYIKFVGKKEGKTSFKITLKKGNKTKTEKVSILVWANDAIQTTQQPTLPSETAIDLNITEVTVGTQNEMQNALKLFPNLCELIIHTDLAETFKLDGNYPNLKVILDAPLAEFYNFASVKEVDIYAISSNTWHEEGSNNIINLFCECHIIVDEKALNITINVNKDECSSYIENNSSTTVINVVSKAVLDIFGKHNTTTINVKSVGVIINANVVAKIINLELRTSLVVNNTTDDVIQVKTPYGSFSVSKVTKRTIMESSGSNSSLGGGSSSSGSNISNSGNGSSSGSNDEQTKPNPKPDQTEEPKPEEPQPEEPKPEEPQPEEPKPEEPQPEEPKPEEPKPEEPQPEEPRPEGPQPEEPQPEEPRPEEPQPEEPQPEEPQPEEPQPEEPVVPECKHEKWTEWSNSGNDVETRECVSCHKQETRQHVHSDEPTDLEYKFLNSNNNGTHELIAKYTCEFCSKEISRTKTEDCVFGNNDIVSYNPPSEDSTEIHTRVVTKSCTVCEYSTSTSSEEECTINWQYSSETGLDVSICVCGVEQTRSHIHSKQPDESNLQFELLSSNENGTHTLQATYTCEFCQAEVNVKKSEDCEFVESIRKNPHTQWNFGHLHLLSKTCNTCGYIVEEEESCVINEDIPNYYMYVNNHLALVRYCSICENDMYFLHNEHTLGEWFPRNDQEHRRECECTTVREDEDHIFEDCYNDDIGGFQCSKCGYLKIVDPHNHGYGLAGKHGNKNIMMDIVLNKDAYAECVNMSPISNPDPTSGKYCSRFDFRCRTCGAKYSCYIDHDIQNGSCKCGYTPTNLFSLIANN